MIPQGYVSDPYYSPKDLSYLPMKGFTGFEMTNGGSISPFFNYKSGGSGSTRGIYPLEVRVQNPLGFYADANIKVMRLTIDQ